MAPAAKLGDSQMMSFMGFSWGWGTKPRLGAGAGVGLLLACRSSVYAATVAPRVLGRPAVLAEAHAVVDEGVAAGAALGQLGL